MRIPRFGGLQTVGLGQLKQRAREERYTILKQQMLHFHAHNLQPVDYDFGFPF